MTHRWLVMLVLPLLVTACGSSPGAGSGGSGGISGSGGEGGAGGSGGQGGSGGAGGSGGGGGSGGSMGTCEDQLADFDACGGDIVGTWTIDSTCTGSLGALAGALTAICSSATFTATPSASGTWTFNADGTASRDSTLTLTGIFELPDACLAALGFGSGGASTCAALPAVIPGVVKGATVTCDYASAVCSCSLSFSSPAKDTGHYTVSDGTLTLADQPSAPTIPFCIDGDEMTVESNQTLQGQTLPVVLVLHR